jgi:hypothetical protein
MTATIATCPACGKRAGVRIIYGMPSHEVFEAEERGEVAIGGCIVGESDHRCRECGFNWRSEDFKIAVPRPDADWLTIWRFALTYNGYDHHGDRAGDMSNRARDRWEQSGVLPRTLDSARTALFFEQRRYHHFGTDPDAKSERYIRELVGRIGKLSGGSVAGPPDPSP